MPPGAALPRAIFFDMDDTIFDHSLTCYDSLRKLRREHPVLRGQSVAALWQEYLRLLDAVQPEIRSGRLSITEARRRRFERLARFCGGSATPEEAEEFSQEYRRNYQSLRRLVPGARRLLEQLHGRTLVGIVTNNETREQQEKIAHHHLTPLVDVLVVSEEAGVSKPDPRIFETALKRADVEAGDSVMIGDSWTSDVLGARNAGIGAVWFNRFRRPFPGPIMVPEVRSFRAPRQVERVLVRAAARSRTGLK
jgi:HAD superfamily hydrolase (TIGR01549 family)